MLSLPIPNLAPPPLSGLFLELWAGAPPYHLSENGKTNVTKGFITKK
jgi:hypothetical protein